MKGQNMKTQSTLNKPTILPKQGEDTSITCFTLVIASLLRKIVYFKNPTSRGENVHWCERNKSFTFPVIIIKKMIDDHI